MIRLKPRVVVDHIVVCGGDRALADMLADQEEVIPSLPCNGVVNDCVRRQVIQSFGSSAKDPSRDVFLHNHHSQLRRAVFIKHGETAADLRNFILSHSRHLPVSNSVSEHKDSIRNGVVLLIVFLRAACRHNFSPSIISWVGMTTQEYH